MPDIKHIIEPERQGLWIAVTFIIALIALALSVISITRIDDTVAATQLEILYLNKKIDGMNAAPAAVAPAEPMAPAAPQ